jgi:hypothetical protein
VITRYFADLVGIYLAGFATMIAWVQSPATPT